MAVSRPIIDLIRARVLLKVDFKSENIDYHIKSVVTRRLSTSADCKIFTVFWF